MDLIIRMAEDRDSNEIATMMLEFEDYMEKMNPRVWRITDYGRSQIMKRVNALISDMRYTIIAENEEMKGFASAHIIRRANFSPGTIGFIDMIYVKKDHRRKGTALRMLNDICNYFTKEKVNEINLRYVVGNIAAFNLWNELSLKPVLTTMNTSLDEFQNALIKKI